MDREEYEINRMQEAREQYFEAIKPAMKAIESIYAITPNRMTLGSNGAIGSMEPAFTKENQLIIDMANETIKHMQRLYFGKDLLC